MPTQSMKAKYSLIIFTFLHGFLSNAQTHLDSLWLLWNDQDLHDTIRLDAMRDIAWDGYLTTQPDSAFFYAQKMYTYAKEKGIKSREASALNTQGASFYMRGDFDQAITYYKRALEEYEAIGHIKGISGCITNIGGIAQAKGNYDLAFENYSKGIEIFKKIGDNQGLAMNYNNLAMILTFKGNSREAINYYSKSLKIAEAQDDQPLISKCFNNIGLIYMAQKDYNKAIEFFTKSLAIMESLEDMPGQALCLNNIGLAYSYLEDYQKARSIYRKSYLIDSSLKNIAGQARIFSNVGFTYHMEGNLEKAFENYTNGLQYSKELKDNNLTSLALNNLGSYYLEIADYKKSIEYSEQALSLSQEIGAIEHIEGSSEVLWTAYKNVGQFKSALQMYELFIESRDSILSDENQKASIRQEYQYAYEKQAAADSIKSAEEAKVKDAQLAAEQAENKQHQLEAKQQEQQKYFLYGGLGLALLFGGFIFNRFRVTSKQKGIIEEQKHKVDEAYGELEEKNTEILDSINYAKRIQSAILPPNKLVKEYLQSSFILYKPKDIVAGDFYWLEPTKDAILFAAADCTGHGVPGAMVSVVCNNGLNRSVREHGLIDPGKILDKTREIVISEFEKSEEEVKDGMDIALCSLQGTTLKYSGAHNPLWIFRKDAQEVEEIKADKQPIGKYDEPKPYTTHTIELNPGDSFYIFSDGYADQFGGEKGKKLKAKNFKALLLSMQNESMEKQRELIDEAFETWKGKYEQLDDVCVIGVRV